MSKLNFLARYGSGSHIDDALNPDRQWSSKYAAIQNPNATSEQLYKILNNKKEPWVIRHDAISNPNATKEHLTLGLKDSDRDVKREAEYRLKDFK